LLGQEYNWPAEAGVLKKPREATLTLTFLLPGKSRRCPVGTRLSIAGYWWLESVHDVPVVHF
jgi:hypothetical protein